MLSYQDVVFEVPSKHTCVQIVIESPRTLLVLLATLIYLHSIQMLCFQLVESFRVRIMQNLNYVVMLTFLSGGGKMYCGGEIGRDHR